MFISGVLSLKVIPVIDILNGIAVHAVKGKRSEYKPLQSLLFKSIEPIEVAKALAALGFKELYIADLDAIIDCSTNFELLRQIFDTTGLQLMVDAGVTNLDRAQKLLDIGASKLIIGTETLQNKNFVAQAVERFGSDCVVVSLDLKGDKVLAQQGFDGSRDPIELLEEFKSMGVSQVIALDLSKVGSSEGVNTELLSQIIRAGFEVYVGGGVRDVSDLVKLQELGVRGALVATALHTGKLPLAELKPKGFI
jgi:phosphoribosylformimino-5-aminoimidazole carboxamide ribotide isomerase